MSSIISNQLFQILTTVILTLLGTAGITYLFYKKQKKDNDKPKIRYWVENIGNGPSLRIERLAFDHINNLTLTSINPNNKSNYCLWRESIKIIHTYEVSIERPIPKPQRNMYSFKVKIQYQYKEHNYTDKLTIYPLERRCTLH